MELVLEIFLCAGDKAGSIRYARLQVDITDQRNDPDVLLQRQLEDVGVCLDSDCSLVHSTSWRYEEGATFLTYLVWSSLEKLKKLPTSIFVANDYVLAVAEERRKPRPLDIDHVSVLSHGLRHFRFLAEQQELPSHDPELHKSITKAICQCVPVVAGRI